MGLINNNMNLFKQICFMKLLEEIDSLYQATISKLPKEEKIAYCENLIDKAQNNLIRNKNFIHEGLENQLYTLILAARTELNKLKSEK